MDDLYKHLAESLALATPAAKKHRLKCLLSLVKKLDIENFDFIPSILPEVSQFCLVSTFIGNAVDYMKTAYYTIYSVFSFPNSFILHLF